MVTSISVISKTCDIGFLKLCISNATLRRIFAKSLVFFPRSGCWYDHAVRSFFLPALVSRHTSQSGLSGLENHGSAQPRLMQLTMVRFLIFVPSSSNSGSFPPGWLRPLESQRFWVWVRGGLSRTLPSSLMGVVARELFFIAPFKGLANEIRSTQNTQEQD